jgi:predicted porin
MKKTLIALAALAATGAFAQVSVYGRLDIGYGNHTITNGATETKLNGVESHNSVSSMWGIQGSEDLGGGLKANFKLEQDVYLANGNTGNSGSGNGALNSSGFNRTSTLGLSGAFGSVNFGRDYTPVFKLVAASDIFGLTRLSNINQAGVAVGNTGNLIAYSTPNFSGFQANLGYINQDGSTTASDTKVSGTHLTATYANGPLSLGRGSGKVESTAGVTGAVASKDEGQVLTAGYNFGVVALKGNMINRKQTSTAAVETEDKEVTIGATMPMGKVTLLAQVGNNTKKITSGTGVLTNRKSVV